MNNLISTPFQPIYIRNRYLAQTSKPKGLQKGFLVAIQVNLNEAPKLMVMTEAGAMFCFVPPHAVCFDPDAIEMRDVCPWDCLSDQGEIVKPEFLIHRRLEWRDTSGQWHKGRYLFSLNFGKQHWASIPEQYKVFHFVQSKDGNLHITVNNRSRWICDAVDQSSEFVPESNIERWFYES